VLYKSISGSNLIRDIKKVINEFNEVIYFKNDIYTLFYDAMDLRLRKDF